RPLLRTRLRRVPGGDGVAAEGNHPGGRQQPLAVWADGPAAAGAGDPPHIQAGFEASDPSAHRAVADAELLGRTDQGAGLGEDVEVPHIFRVDSHAGTSSGLGLRLYPDRSGARLRDLLGWHRPNALRLTRTVPTRL